jgi:hypothetical protein
MTGAGKDNSTIVDRPLFQPYLEHGEKVLWIGRPRFHWGEAGYRILWVLVGLVVVGLILGIRSASGPPSGVGQEDTSHVEIYLGYAGIACLMLLGAMLWGVGRHLIATSRVTYLLSERRAMALDRRSGKLLKSVSLGEVDQLDQILRSDGSGRVIFDYDLVYSKSRGTTRAFPKLEFADIESAAAVRALAEEAALKLLAKDDEAEP